MNETLLIEFAKLGIQVFFQALEMAGKTDEEIQVMFLKEKEAFLDRKPENLPDV